jgi:hypothetical protein
MEAREIRQEIEALERGRTTPIPQATRERVLAYTRRERSRGKSWRTIGDELGLSPAGLQRWSKGSGGRSRLRPVRVVTSPAPSSLALVSPRGYRLEGLSLEQAVQVLGELS